MRRDPDAAGQAVATSGGLEDFTDREDYLAAFTRHAERPAGEELSLLVFYGVGGIGKTTLLRKLCAGLARPDGAPPLPHARFNLENVRDQAQAYRDVLLRLRSDFESDARIAFPRFDLALAVLLAAEGGQQPGLIRVSPGLGQVFAFAMELTPGFVKGSFKLAGDGINGLVRRSEPLERWVRQVGGTDAVLALSEQFAGDDEAASAELIRRFAQDLAAGLPARPGRACRGALFLDTYEALWTGRDGVSAQARALDGWVRLLAEYLLGAGVLPVIAGRDRLPWGDDDPDWESCLDQHLLGGVSAPDAQSFLARRGIGRPPPQPPDPLQAAILRCTDTAPGVPDGAPGGASCHLLALALSADIVRNTRGAGGADPDPALFQGVPPARLAGELATRFLKSLHNRNLELWVEALSLTPRFDEAAALALDAARQLHVGRAGWEQLRRYSFVTAQPDGFLRMHRTMREVLGGRTEPGAARALHAWFAAYWDGRGEDALAFAHRWRLDPAGELDAWTAAHADALDGRRTADARALLTRWADVALDGDDRAALDDALWARTHAALGAALQRTPLAPRHVRLTGAMQHLRAALSVFGESTSPDDWAAAQEGLGLAHRDLPTGDRAENLRRAEACFRAAGRVWAEASHPGHWAELQASLGITCAYRPTGDRAANLNEATGFFEAALRVWTRAGQPQQWADMQNALGCNCLLMPGDDRAGRMRRAAGFFEAALQVRSEAEAPLPWARTQHNLGITYFNLGDEDPENLRRAIAHCRAALRVHTEADLPDVWADSQNTLGVSWFGLGGSLLDRGDADAAADALHAAVACFEAAQRVWTEADDPPHWAQAQNNKGRALLRLSARSPDQEGRVRDAIACFRDALRVHTEERFPENCADARKNLALALRASGDPAARAEARACLADAARGFRSVGMEADAADAERLTWEGG